MVVDYGVNDPLFTATRASQRQYLGMMRAATEQLVRRLLLRAEQRGEESFALLYLAMQRSWENASYAFADEVYSPVCAAYGVPVVSVRDALWPDVALPVTHAQARLWQTKNGAHPSWHGHQLVADLLALTLAHADHQWTSLFGHYDLSIPLLVHHADRISPDHLIQGNPNRFFHRQFFRKHDVLDQVDQNLRIRIALKGESSSR